jgi:hypothetical protein
MIALGVFLVVRALRRPMLGASVTVTGVDG